MDPIDFESFILKNKTLMQNDPQRELLLYPPDDVSVSIFIHYYIQILIALLSGKCTLR